MKINVCLPLIALLLFACGQGEKTSSEKSSTSEANVSSESGDNAITFKVDGQQVNSSGWIVQRFVWDEKTPAPWLNITSNMHKDKRSINVNLNAANAGKYSFSETASIMTNPHGSYFPDFGKPMESFSFVGGEFNITEVDTAKGILNGTFSITAKDINGKTISITEGKFTNLKLKSGVTNISKGIEDATK
jgi:hypothetical protein